MIEFLPDEDEIRGLAIETGKGEVILSPSNTTIVKHIGKSAIDGVTVDNERFNHIVVEMGQRDDGSKFGALIFSFQRIYDEVEDYLENNQYPQLLNQRGIDEDLVAAYQAAVQNIVDGIPDSPAEWFDESDK